MEYSIRSPEQRDRGAILTLVFDAFSSPGRDGQEEVEIVENSWARGASIEGLELIAVDGHEVIGHVLGARGDLDCRDVVAVAPLAVAPAHQGCGVGTSLMNDLILHAENQGWPLIVLLGDPAYYGRFGFEGSSTYGIEYEPVGSGNPHFLVRCLPMFDASLRGKVRYCWELPEE